MTINADSVESTLTYKNFDGSSQGRSLKDGEFTFMLYDSNGTELQIKRNDAQGKVTFDPIAFGPADAGKEYSYTVREKKGTDQEVIYDENEERVSISVTQG